MGWVVAVSHRRRRPEHRRAIATNRRTRHWLMTSVGDGLSPNCGRQHFDVTPFSMALSSIASAQLLQLRLLP